MNKKVITMYVFFIMLFSVNILPEEKLITEANKLISELEIDKAVKLYEQEIKRGSPTVDVLYEYGMLKAKLGDLKTAQQTFDKLLTKSQISLYVRRFVGDFFFYCGDITKAEKIYKETLEEYEKEKKDGVSYAWANCGLGKVSLVKGKFADAEKFFTLALEQKFAPNCARNAAYGLNLSKGFNKLEKWSSVETDNFVFIFSPQIKELQTRIAQEMYARIRQEAFEKICKTLSVKIEGVKIRFYVFLNDKEAYDITGAGAHYSETSWWIIFSVYGQSIGHEMTHQISARIFFGRPDSLLLCEGICVVYDQNPLSTKHDTAQKLLEKKELPTIIDLEVQPKKYNYYPLSGSFVLFLIDQYGIDKFKQLWILYDFYKNAEANKGNIAKALDSLFLKVYQKDTKTIQDEWCKAIKK